MLLGSFPEQAGAGERPFNTVSSSARRVKSWPVTARCTSSTWRSPGAPAHRESRCTQPGTEVVTAPLPGTPFISRLAVCLRLRFPELFRAQVSRGANLFLLPAAFTYATGRDHWEVLLRARAIENLSYVVAPAQWGRHAPGRRSYGRSLIIDPWGLVLAQAPDG